MTVWITLLILSVSFIFVNCAEKEFSTCFHHFGCVNFTNEWFDSKFRPSNLAPLERHTVNTKFLLFTGAPDSNVICYDTLSPNPFDINKTVYENHLESMILIHDFTSNGYTGWIKHMVQKLSALERYNIISVDWQEGAEPPFLQAISNARIVAMEIQLLLYTLMEHFSLILSEVHIIGHGVGAHIAGYVGKEMEGYIGRITGLDPTGPLFEGMPPVVRLDYKDAIYVEVLHTDGTGTHRQGTMQPMGNMDFYFNHGYDQPGCHNLAKTWKLNNVRRDSLKEGTVLPNCNHKRAFKYYMSALQENPCKFIALPVGTAQNMSLRCVPPEKNRVLCATVGLDVDIKLYSMQTYAKYDINTGPCQPFCTNRYQIVIDFAPCVEAEAEATGYFNMLMTDDEGTQANITFNKAREDSQPIQLNKTLTFTTWVAGTPIETVEHIQVTWHFTTPFCYLCRNATCVHSVGVTHVRSFITLADAPFFNQFCPTGSGNYSALYDQAPTDQFVKCNKNKP